MGERGGWWADDPYVGMVYERNGRRRLTGGQRVEVEAPDGWVAIEATGGVAVREAPAPDLVLECPQPGRADAARVSVTLAPRGATLDEDSRRVAACLEGADPSAYMASCDVWPHPVWGDGLLLQSARIGDGATFAHDCFLFHDESDLVLVDVQCVLDDLLTLEDEVADIVARTRPLAARGEGA